MYEFPTHVVQACSAEAIPSKIKAIVSTLSDADLAALEDDLDFFGFAHVPSARMLAILDRLDVLDPEWRSMLDSQVKLALPAVA